MDKEPSKNDVTGDKKGEIDVGITQYSQEDILSIFVTF